MRPSKRKPVHKAASASQFRRNVSRTHRINHSATPMRGGFRL